MGNLYQTIKADELLSIEPDAPILDVRTTAEHAEKRLSRHHEHIPLDQLTSSACAAVMRKKQGKPLYILCKSGKRAAMAADTLSAHGCTNLHVIEGGITACEASGFGTESATRRTRPIAIERQVRIIAGGLVAAGSLAAVLINPLIGIVPLLIGTGLVFAGITEWCGMQMLLMKAPWNQ